MTLQLQAMQTWTITGRSGRVHVLTVWCSTALGDWASCTIDDVPMIEITGDAVNRATACCQAVATQLSQ